MAHVRRGISAEGKAKIAQLLRGYRVGTGMSLREFARKLNTSHKRLSAIETGSSEVTREMLEGFCRASGFDLDVILACAGMIRYDYSDALRTRPNVFVTLLQLLSPGNIPSTVGEALDYSVSQLRGKLGVPTGKVMLDEKVIRQLLQGMIDCFQDSVLELKTPAGD